MANSSNSKSSKSSSSSSSNSGNRMWSLNKISFWTVVAVAVLYLIAMVLSACGVNLKVVGALQGVATAVMIAVVTVLAWKFVRNRQMVWKVLYIVCLLVVLIGIIIPLVV